MNDFIFEGFEPANTTPVPDVLFDELLSELNESELKVLLYIIRRTAGFKKQTDAISLTQFQKGIKKRATGEILDRGCGVKDRATIVKALASLERKGCIESTKAHDPQGDAATSSYRIRFRASSNGVVGKTNHPNDMGSGQNQPPWFAKPTTGSGQSQPGVVGDSNPQETVIQPNSKQETVEEEGTQGQQNSHAQECADAHTVRASSQTLENTPYRPQASHSQSPTEDTNGSDNHGSSDHRPATPAAAHRVGDSAGADDHEQRSQAQGAQASNAQNQGHTTTTVAPAGGSGYRTPAEQSTLMGVSQQTSAHVEREVDIKKLSLQAHTDYVFRWLDEIKKEAKKDQRASYVKSDASEKKIRALITACWNTDKELTRENVRKAYRQMWNSKPSEDGFSWKKAGITINAFQNNYGEYLERAWDEEAKQQARTTQQASAPLPTASTPTVSGLPRWVPPSATAYAH